MGVREEDFSSSKKETARKQSFSVRESQPLPQTAITINSPRDEGDSLHLIELIHFVFMELKQRDSKQILTNQTMKVLILLYPSLVYFVAGQPIPLTHDIKTVKKPMRLEVQSV